MNTSLMLLAATEDAIKKFKLDLQNAFRLGNVCFLQAKKKMSEAKADVILQNAVESMLDWSEILGYGFSTKDPEKLQKWYDKYSTKKQKKITKYLLKNYPSLKESNELLQKYLDDTFMYFRKYIEVAFNAYQENDSEILTEFDPKYYDYAIKEYQSWHPDFEIEE